MAEGLVGSGAPSLASVLFTDVVGSTELRQRLGEEAADRLQQAHDRLMTDVVVAAAGRVIKGTGDGVLAVFDAAADAVAAGVAIQQAVESHGRVEPRLAFEVRVGVSAGDVVARDGDVFGTVVVEASRLCEAAQGGQVLVADLVRVLARGRGGFVFEPVGELALKGLEGPVAACQVAWTPALDRDEESLPFPALLAPPTATGYVGRPGLLGRLEQLWAQVVSGGGSAGVLLAGEPGVGKTRTAAEAARSAYGKGGLALYGRCDESLSLPYQPFVEALDFQSRHDASLPLGRLAGELARLVPELAARVPGLAAPVVSDAQVEQHRLFEAVASWLAQASYGRGLVLVLDDLQWAGEPTLDLLVHVVRVATADPQAHLLVIGTYRDTDVDRAHPLSAALGELRRAGAVERLAVDTLSSEEVLALVESAAGHELEPEARALAGRVHRETQGNPFFVGEVLRHFIETGVVVLQDGRWYVSEPDHVDVPEGVRDVVGRRLSRLSGAANQVLALAAVVGPEVDVEVLAGLVDGGIEVVLDALDEALGARLLQETGTDRVAFTHSLVRATLYEELSASRRRRTHAQVVDVLEQLRPDEVAALAHHAVQAGPVDGRLGRAVGHCVAAGQAALAQRAHADARGWFTQALELADEDAAAEPQVVLAARCGLGQVLHELADPAARQLLLQTGHDALDADQLHLAVAAATANSRLSASIIGAVDTEKTALLEAILDRLGPDSTGQRARILALLAVELTFDPDQTDRHLALADQAVDVARETSDQGLEAWVLTTTAFAVLVPARMARLPQRAARMVELADRTGDPALRSMSRVHAAATAINVGDIAGARQLAETAARLAAAEASPTIVWITRTATVQFLAYDGDLAAARQANDDCLALGQQAGEPDAAVWWGAIAASIATLDGTSPQLADAYGAFADQYPDTVAWRTAQVVVLALSGRHEEARQLLVDHGLTDPARVPHDWITLLTWTVLAQAAYELDAIEVAQRLLPLATPHRDLWGTNGLFSLFPVELAVGLAAAAAGRWDDAVDATRRAHHLLHERGMRSHQPFASLYLARVLAGRGHPDDLHQARTVATDGLRAAAALGMDAIATELQQHLDQLS